MSYTGYKYLIVCPSCGEFISGGVSCSERTSFPYKFMLQRKEDCPVCYRKIPCREDYIVWSSENSSHLHDELVEKLNQYESIVCQEEIAKQIKKAKTYAEKPAGSPFAKRLNENIEELKQYLQHLINLRFAERFLEEQLSSLNKRNCTAMRDANHKYALELKKEQRHISQDNSPISKQIDELEKEFKKINWEKEVIPEAIEVPKKPKLYSAAAPKKPEEPILKKPNFLNKKRVLEQNAQLTKEYEQAMEKYKKDLEKHKEKKEKNKLLREEYDAQLEEYKIKVEEAEKRAIEERKIRKKEARAELNKKIKELKKQMKLVPEHSLNQNENIRVKLLTEEIQKSKNLLVKVSSAVNRLLSENILYPSYRDLYALTSFYEYFNSKRCYMLEGPDGAYNLYEAERRANVVSDFFRKLEDIGKNQVILYRMANEMYHFMENHDNACDKMLGISKGSRALKNPADFIPTEKAIKDYTDLSAKQKEKIEQQIVDALNYVSD